MQVWIDVVPVSSLPPGACCVVEVEGQAVAVFNLDGEYYAIEDVCTHDGGDLASGDVEGDRITCPRHGACFSIRTGKVLSPPAYEDLRTFQVRVAHGKVQVGIENF
ncbi:MAG: non-heme iron oxygenase ferredoxin subunit [Methylophilaceae bacterium]